MRASHGQGTRARGEGQKAVAGEAQVRDEGRSPSRRPRGRTRATPTDAPAPMPRESGPARWLRNTVCRMRPDTARAAPPARPGRSGPWEGEDRDDAQTMPRCSSGRGGRRRSRPEVCGPSRRPGPRRRGRGRGAASAAKRGAARRAPGFLDRFIVRAFDNTKRAGPGGARGGISRSSRRGPLED